MKDKNIAKKEKAIELLKEMDIYTPYIKGFEEKGLVCFFENYGGFWIDQENCITEISMQKTLYYPKRNAKKNLRFTTN